MKNQKGISTLVGIIIIVVILVIALGGVLTYQYLMAQKTNVQPQVQSQQQNQNQQQQTVNQQTNNAQPIEQNSGWKIYSNTRYGFQIQYPTGAVVKDVNTNSGISVSFSTSNGKMVIETENNVSGGKYTASCNTASGVDPFYKTIDGVTFTAVDMSRLLSGNVSTSATEYCALQNGIGYKLIPQIPYGNSSARVDVNNDTVLNQMISTFKFTK